jgi:hypothetical protein
MRLLFLSLGVGMGVLGTARAQSDNGGGMPQLPVGQTFKQFELPIYQLGTLKATVNAVEAKGITLNRVQTTDLRIELYENGTVTTTVTSPIADLYVNPEIAEQRMRTKNTVRVERSDMTATAQDCDFDLRAKKYLLRTNVKVILKHFDLSQNTPGSAPTTSKPPPATVPATTPAPLGPISPNAAPLPSSSSLLDSPGSYSTTNAAPGTPSK